jgi:hypothetical protein
VPPLREEQSCACEVLPRVWRKFHAGLRSLRNGAAGRCELLPRVRPERPSLMSSIGPIEEMSCAIGRETN